MTDTNKMTMDPDTLAAFVDGELSPEDAALVIMHLEANPADRAFVERIERANVLLAKAFDAPLYEPVPERIAATIRDHQAADATVVPFTRRRVPAPVWGGLLAASIAIALGIGVLPGQGGNRLNVGAVASASMLSDVLDTLPTGSVSDLQDIGAEATLLSSFIDAQDRGCREFEVAADATVERGIACRDSAGWTIVGRVTLPEVDPEADGTFVPAGGEGGGVLDAVLDRLGAGMILTHEEEEALIARDWAN